MPEVALVISRYNALGGGAQRWTHAHAQRLLADGFGVHLVASSFRDPPPGARCHEVIVSESRWVRVCNAMGVGGPQVGFAHGAERLLRAINPDLIHDMGDGHYFDVCTCHHGNRRAVFDQRTMLASPLLRWVRPLAFHVLPRYRRFVSLEKRQFLMRREGRAMRSVMVSNMVRDQLLHEYPGAADRIEVIHNGVDISRYGPDPSLEMRRLVRRSLGWEDRIIFLFAAHDYRLKGLDTVLRALPQVARVEPGVGVLVIGGGRIARYRKTAQRQGVLPHTAFLGDQPEVLPAMRAADALVHPTLYDTCSLVSLEAMAAGLSVITTRANGVNELIESGHGEVIDDPLDDESLAQAMVRTAALVRREGPPVRPPTNVESLSSETMFEKYMALYDRILKERGKSLPAIRSAPRAAASTARVGVPR